MSDKQVIMSKKEFDSMEEELNNLRKIVKDKTITKIKTPHLGWQYGGPCVDGYFTEYIFGTKESEVIKDLKEELEQVRKNRDEINKVASNLEHSINWLKSHEDDWKNLPWYKRLFVK